jgi:hypothetical protein
MPGTQRTVVAGIVTIGDIRNGDPAACTLVPGAIALAPVPRSPLPTCWTPSGASWLLLPLDAASPQRLAQLGKQPVHPIKRLAGRLGSRPSWMVRYCVSGLGCGRASFFGHNGSAPLTGNGGPQRQSLGDRASSVSHRHQSRRRHPRRRRHLRRWRQCRRLQTLAEPGEICVSASVRELAPVAFENGDDFSHGCAGRPARSRWCKSTAMKE